MENLEFLKTENLVNKTGGKVGIEQERQETKEGKSLCPPLPLDSTLFVATLYGLQLWSV